MVGDVSVRELARRSFVGVSEGDTVRDAAAVMAAEGGEDAVVLRGEEPVGHLAVADVLALVADGDAPAHTVAEVMADPAPSIDADRPVADAAAVLNAAAVGHLLVTNGSGGGLLGVLGDRDVVAAAAMAPDEREPPAIPYESRTDPAAEGGFSEQSVCEACGTFAPNLAGVNGQLLCVDCRQV